MINPAVMQGDDFTIGSIPINSLCSVIPPDESEAAAKNEWTFIVHSRRKSYQLTTKAQSDANRWINAIQDVIDASPIIETLPTSEPSIIRLSSSFSLRYI